MRHWTSWNGNIRHGYTEWVEPDSEASLAKAVSAAERVRVVGSGCSSADIVGGPSTLVSLSRTYQDVVSVDQGHRLVTVQAGMTVARLVQVLAEHGWSLPALPDIDAVTVGGALATGTHGTGRDAHLLSAYVVAMSVVLADGTVRTVSDAAELEAFRLGLGVLAVTSTVTFQAEPAYELQVHGQPVRDAVWLRRWESWLREYEFLRILWLPHTGYGFVYRGDKVTVPSRGVTVRPPPWVRHRRRVSAIAYRATTHVPAATPLANRLLYSLFFANRVAACGPLYDATVTKSRSSTMELAEWTIDRAAFSEALGQMRAALHSWRTPHVAHLPMDVRFLSRDSTWLSYAYNRDVVTVGLVCRVPHAADRYSSFDLMQRVFTSLGGRPHWAKRHSWGPVECAQAWPRFDGFRRLRAELDPQGKFLNDYLARLLPSGEEPERRLTVPTQRRRSATPAPTA
jgi:L-gulonolactone oxidase